MAEAAMWLGTCRKKTLVGSRRGRTRSGRDYCDYPFLSEERVG